MLSQRLNKPLEDGDILTINDTYGNGSITYTCSAGTLEKSASSCTSKSKVTVGATNNAKETIISTQNADTNEAHVALLFKVDLMILITTHSPKFGLPQSQSALRLMAIYQEFAS